MGKIQLYLRVKVTFVTSKIILFSFYLHHVNRYLPLLEITYFF